MVVQDDDYDFEARARKIEEALSQSCSDINFTAIVVHEQADVVALSKRADEFDAFVVYTLGIEYMRVIFEAPLAETGKPLLIVDDYLEHYGFHNYIAMRRMGLPVLWMASSEIQDVIAKVRLLPVVRRLQNATMLRLTGEGRETHIFGQPVKPFEEALSKVFGTRLARMSKEELSTVYLPNVSDQKAKEIAQQWIHEADAVVEPSLQDVVTSARVYLAIKQAIEDKNVQAFTTDIAGYMYEKWPDDVFQALSPGIDPINRGAYPHVMPTFPCLAFMQLQSDGFPATGEMNLHTLLNILVMHELTKAVTGEPHAGFSGGRLFDLSRSAIIYHLCCGPRKFFGPSGPACSYTLRTEQETNHSCAASVVFPSDTIVTAVSIHPEENVMIVHQGQSLGSVHSERRCRNKLAVEVNIEHLIENNLQPDWPLGRFRSVFFGDWRSQLRDLATLLGMDYFDEDRDYAWPPQRRTLVETPVLGGKSNPKVERKAT